MMRYKNQNILSEQEKIKWLSFVETSKQLKANYSTYAYKYEEKKHILMFNMPYSLKISLSTGCKVYMVIWLQENICYHHIPYHISRRHYHFWKSVLLMGRRYISFFFLNKYTESKTKHLSINEWPLSVINPIEFVSKLLLILF